MKPPIIRYSKDQQKEIALLEKQPLTRDELLAHFPSRNKNLLAAMLRTPTQTGKVFLNAQGKYQLSQRLEEQQGLTVIQGRPMPYSPPRKFEFIYEQK